MAKFGIALLVLGLSVGLVGFVGTTMITDSVEERTLDTQQQLAEQSATQLDEWNDQNRQTTTDIALAQTLIYGDTQEVQQYLDELSFAYEEAHYVNLETMEVEATTRDDVDGVDDLYLPDADREALQEVGESEVSQTTPYRNDNSDPVNPDQPVVGYYTKVPGTGNNALIVTANLANFGSDSTEDTAVTIVDEQAQIVADDRVPGFEVDGDASGEDGSSFLREYDDPDGLLADATQTSAANRSDAAVYSGSGSSAIQSAPYNFQADEYVGAYHGTEMGWTVLTHTSTEDAYGFVATVNQWGIYATIAGVLLIGLVGAVIGRNTATSIDKLTGKVAEMEEGNLDVEFETKRIDNIGRLYNGFAEMRDELKTQITEAENARAEAEQERERVQQLYNELQSAASSYCDVMEEAADGDLTVRMDPSATDNETMQEIGEDFNDMLTEIEATVESLNQFATEVATASEQVTASSEEVRSASEQVSESVQEISDGANQQYESLRSVDNEMSNLSTTTEEIAASSNEVADVAERTARTGRDGREAAREAINAVETLEDERESVVDEFEQLRDDVAQIDHLVERVGEIAEQTNMLALNANIEASRSAGGDDDGGFAAVAAEVKELSQDVKEATEEIDDQLEGIQTQTERSADEVDRTSDEIERVGELVTETVDALEEIAEYAQETNDGVQEISAATEEQAASTEEVVAMIDDVASIAEQTTTEAEGVAAAAEEQTTAMTEVSNSANDLTEQAMALSEALDRFETDAPADASVVDLEYDGSDDDDDGADSGQNADEAFSFGEPAAGGSDSSDDEAGESASITSDEPSDGETESEAGVTDDDATWGDKEDETFSLDG